MTATYTFDAVATLDGYGSYGPDGDWGGYWGKQGPELVASRVAALDEVGRLVLGPGTVRDFAQMLAGITEDSAEDDPINFRMKYLPTTVISSTLTGPLDWPDATIVNGDAVDVVARLKAESDAPILSHGSVSLNWSLMAAGLVDRVRVTIFPVISGRTGVEPIFGGAGDFDLELLEAKTLDGRTQELTYRPHVH
jgi:dihydrofolate reductase